MADNEFDFSAAPRAEDLNPDKYDQLRKLVGEMVKAEARVRDHKAAMELAESDLARYRDKDIPTHARSMGWTAGTIDGREVEIRDDVVGSLPKKAEDPEGWATAIATLEKMGEGDSVKRFLIISLGKDAEALEKRILEGLSRVAPKAEVEKDVSVHPGTLKRIAKEYLRDGKQIDLKTLGLVKLPRCRIKGL